MMTSPCSMSWVKGVDPKDLEMTQALSGSTTTMVTKKRGVSNVGVASGCG